MGNTLGAIVFLAAATYLGWTVVRGRAQSFLAAVSGGGSGAVPPGSPPPKTPGTPQGGPVAGGGFTFGDQLPSLSPTVAGDIFGTSGLPAYGIYGPYSPNESNAYQYNLGSSVYSQLFGLP